MRINAKTRMSISVISTKCSYNLAAARRSRVGLCWTRPTKYLDSSEATEGRDDGGRDRGEVGDGEGNAGGEGVKKLRENGGLNNAD